jgi:hypothetical protein
MLIGCSDWFGDKKARRQFDVCIDGAKQKELCKKLLHFDVLRSAAPYTPKENELVGFMSGRTWFDVRLPNEPRLPSDHNNGKYEITVRVNWENFDAYRKRWSFGPNTIAVNKEVGEIFITSEDDHKDDWSPHPTQPKLNAAQLKERGYFYAIPRSKDKHIFFQCKKPFHAVSGAYVTDVGCRVRAELSPYVLIEYLIKLPYLQEWESIHKQVTEQLAPVLTVTYITQGN